ncbi:hypothetical protein GCM10020000_50350 [Streptomyces olivoverticillatus]
MRDRARAQNRRRVGTAVAVSGLLLVATSSASAQADTIRSRQWHLDAMHADEMWKISTGAGITVAVIDSGVDDTLPDLQGQVLEGKDFTGKPGGAHTDTEGHGTGMAAFIAGTGKRGEETGSYGLAPGAKILPLRVAGASNFVKGSAAMASAIRYAADSEAKIINISMAGGGESPEEDRAIEYALTKGKLIFAGVGNTGDKSNMLEYPAASPGVIGVAATDQDGKAASFSQHGPQVDLAAPGVDMIAACPGGSGTCRSKGTSDATALASASAALVWSVHPDWTGNQVARVLINTAGAPQSGAKRTDAIGYGVVRPRIALQKPRRPRPARREPAAGPGQCGGRQVRRRQGRQATDCSRRRQRQGQRRTRLKVDPHRRRRSCHRDWRSRSCGIRDHTPP